MKIKIKVNVKLVPWASELRVRTRHAEVLGSNPPWFTIKHFF